MKKLLPLLFFILSFSAYAQNSILGIYCDGQNNQNDFDFAYNTYYKIDTTTIDYNGCSPTPAFHVVIIDENCQPWGTRWTDSSITPPVVYNPTHNFGQYNSDGFCRDRVEYYFIFRHNNQTELRDMDTLLHTLPDGYALGIYSWMYSDTRKVDSLAPELMTTLQDLGFILYTIPATQNSTVTFSVIKGNTSTSVGMGGGQLGAFAAQGMDLNCLYTSVDEENTIRKTLLYPNPTNGIATLTINNYNSGIISIYNQSGQLVSSDKVSGNNIPIDLTNHANGFYFYVLNDLSGRILTRGKIIKQ